MIYSIFCYDNLYYIVVIVNISNLCQKIKRHSYELDQVFYEIQSSAHLYPVWYYTCSVHSSCASSISMAVLWQFSLRWYADAHLDQADVRVNFRLLISLFLQHRLHVATDIIIEYLNGYFTADEIVVYWKKSIKRFEINFELNTTILVLLILTGDFSCQNYEHGLYFCKV